MDIKVRSIASGTVNNVAVVCSMWSMLQQCLRWAKIWYFAITVRKLSHMNHDLQIWQLI